jgi:hypothetical protein
MGWGRRRSFKRSNGIVDIFDLVLVGRNFGKKASPWE